MPTYRRHVRPHTESLGSSRRAAVALAAGALWLAFAVDAVAQTSAVSDRAALEALYDAAGGAEWTNSSNWLTDAPLSDWFGVTTDAGGRVTELHLHRNALRGSIPTDLGDLAELEYLGLQDNELSGSIPAGLGNLTKLQDLYLWGNVLTGSIPAELGSLANLRTLDLGLNELTGAIPAALGNLARLEWLDLVQNALSGPIPPELGQLTALTLLVVGRNALTGSIPAALGNLVNLERLDLGVNDLSGPIPAALGNLAALIHLELGRNTLSGPIPVALGNLTGLRYLGLDVNDLSGPIPATLGNLAALTRLELGWNTLSGPIPVALGNLTGLRYLDLGVNDLSGPIPVALGNLTGLRYLDLGVNDLSGPIPAALGNLVNLERLDLALNDLSGPIPAALGNLANLKALHLSGNPLTGAIPVSLGSFANLEELGLLDSGLTGPVPTQLGGLTSLRQLLLGENGLSGPIPASLGRLASLEQLDFSYNGLALTGPLPLVLMQLRRLTYLNIAGTALCFPADVAFQEWLAAVDFRRGVTCRDNRSPELVGAIPTQVLTRGTALGVSVTGYFRDPDGDPLAYHVTSNRSHTLGVSVSGGTVWLEPRAEGTATVMVTARDPEGLAATEPMVVTVASTGPQSDYEVLATLYNATGGPAWETSTNWKTPAPLGEWHGVTTNDAGRVTALHLEENGLSGPIPVALEALTGLESLSFVNNDLSGPIPAALGALAALDYLSLSGNGFSGKIPTELGNLVNLRLLALERNALSGPIPPELGRLFGLKVLALSHNALNGPIPPELGRLLDLEWLTLSHNALSGPIPAALGALTGLEVLLLGPNWAVTGPLPSSLRLPHLRALDIWLTQGCAPAEWESWLETIDFSGAMCGTELDVTVDVAVAYTSDVRRAAGNAAAIEAVIDLLIAETNLIFTASGVRHRVALVARTEVTYTETEDSALDLLRLMDPSDGHMDEVHALRDRTGADLVHLIVDKSDVGGRALLGGPFGLTCWGCPEAISFIFTHELGHNMGLEHDRYQVHNHEGGVSTHPAYGYVNQRALPAGALPSTRWRTIMSYNTQCGRDAGVYCNPLHRFSNPRQTWREDPLGVPFGAGDASGVTGPADAAAVLNATGRIVAEWRDRIPAGLTPEQYER